MGKIVWIACKKVMEYKQQREITDEEYEVIKGLDMDDVDSSDGEVYDIIDMYMECIS